MNFDRIIDRTSTNAAKWDSRTLKQKFGDSDVLPLWVADMDFASPDAVSEALYKRADHQIYGYPASNAGFLKAWHKWVKSQHKWDVPLNHAIYIPGIVSAMSLGISLFSEQSDSVILQEPVYQPFRNMIINNGRTPLVNRLILRDGRYYIDFKDLEEKAALKETSLLLLCSPHNPGGRVWSREELEELSRICLKHDVFVISDEIHADLVLNEAKPHTALSSLSEKTARNTMTCQAPSKTFNIAGEKLAIAVLADKKKRERFFQELKRFSLSEGSALALTIGEAAYTRGGEWLTELKKYLNSNIGYIESYLKTELPEVNLMTPDAGFIGWLDFRNCGINHKELEKRFIQIGKIALVEGRWFGEGGDGFFRLNYGCPRSLLEEGLKKLSASLTDDLIHKDSCSH
ncbi:MAG: hypothetical protein B6241_03660 [Spirochaetaceae bacterium 4572_59]|nr:MAG: hypothetical protein B6241_03660 [Spirochaetaceae bacterium 4572_59]